MHPHTPKNPKKPSWFAHRVGDAQLCGGLDLVPNLTPSERRTVDAGMARFVEHGALPRPLRDHLMAIARARGLFKTTEAKAVPKKAKPLAVDGGDPFSTRWTAGTDFAAKILERRPLRPPIRRSA